MDYLLKDGFVGRASRSRARNACVSEDDVKFAKVLGEFSEELLAVLRNRNVSAIAGTITLTEEGFAAGTAD